MSVFEARTMRQADTVVVSLAGECDLRSRDEMTVALLSAVRSGSTVAVDLAEVRFLDSSGLHALVTAYQEALERSGVLYVVNATGTVATVLEITGILALLQRPSPQADQHG